MSLVRSGALRWARLGPRKVKCVLVLRLSKHSAVCCIRAQPLDKTVSRVPVLPTLQRKRSPLRDLPPSGGSYQSLQYQVDTLIRRCACAQLPQTGSAAAPRDSHPARPRTRTHALAFAARRGAAPRTACPPFAFRARPRAPAGRAGPRLASHVASRAT